MAKRVKHYPPGPQNVHFQHYQFDPGLPRKRGQVGTFVLDQTTMEEMGIRPRNWVDDGLHETRRVT